MSDPDELSPIQDDNVVRANEPATSVNGSTGDGDNRPNRLTNIAYVLIALGALLLIARLGWFDLTRLLGVLRFWPILVIAVGVDMLTNGRRRLLVYGTGVAAVLVLSLVGGAGLAGRPANTLEVAQELQGARSADVHVVASMARLELTGAAQNELLASGHIGQQAGERVNVDYVLRGNRGEFRAISSGFRSSFMAFRRSVPWDLTLTGRVPIALTVETGVGESTLDLRQLQLESLNISAGVGETTVNLPQLGNYEASIDGGVGEILVRVPRDLAIRIQVDTGIGSVNAARHFTRSGNTYTSPNYETSTQRVELQLDAGIGSINIQVAD